MIDLRLGDCLSVMPSLPESSIDLVISDGPYFRVKGEEWDRQWEDAAAFLDWMGQLCREWKRVLKPNGSLFVFASPQMAWGVEGAVRREFNVLNNIRWEKQEGWHNKADEEALRSYLSNWEAIIFAEQFGADSQAKGEAGYEARCDELRGFVFEPIRSYLIGEFKRAGVKFEKANEFCGTASMAARHYFAYSQWCMPTAEHYASLQRGLNSNGGEYLRREYEELRREYEELRREYEELRREYEELRRPFDLNCNLPRNDIWRYKTVLPYPGKHVCEKPLPMLIHMVEATTREGATVLDCFMGSGSTGVACVRTDRNFIGIERDAHWHKQAQRRIEQAQMQPMLELSA